MHLFIQYFLFPVIIITNCIFSFSQNSSCQNIIQFAEEQYGVNDVLVNGKLYFPFHKDVEGHPYYPENSFVLGKIYINSQVFVDIPVKYDIEQQKMIIKVCENDKSIKLIVLNPKRIDSINIDGRIFLPSEKNSLILPQKRYFERIWNKGFQFVIYHHISFDPKKNRRNITPGGFSAIYSDKIIIANNKIINVKSKRLFLKLFGSNKKKILEYMKSNNMRYRKANNSQLKQLMQYCYENASIN